MLPDELRTLTEEVDEAGRGNSVGGIGVVPVSNLLKGQDFQAI
tara:strand:- start:266 stop:394 length:129 start_codon:yes stop_codon:yes gene_type:complete